MPSGRPGQVWGLQHCGGQRSAGFEPVSALLTHKTPLLLHGAHQHPEKEKQRGFCHARIPADRAARARRKNRGERTTVPPQRTTAGLSIPRKVMEM